MISVLAIDGTKVEYTKRDLSAGVRPYLGDGYQCHGHHGGHGEYWS